MKPLEIKCKRVDWRHLAQDRQNYRAVTPSSVLVTTHATHFQTIPLIRAFIIIIIIIISSLYSLCSTVHPWRASKRCDLQLSPWPPSMTFLCFLFHPLLSFTTFSSTYLFFYTPEDSNLMRFSPLFLLLYLMCVQSNSIFFFFISIYIGFFLVIPHSFSFVILSVHIRALLLH